MPIKRLVIPLKLFVMGSVTALGSVIHRKSNTWKFSSNTAGCLDIFTGQLRLSYEQHNVQSRHIDSDRYHVRCKKNI